MMLVKILFNLSFVFVVVSCAGVSNSTLNEGEKTTEEYLASGVCIETKRMDDLGNEFPITVCDPDGPQNVAADESYEPETSEF